MMKFFKCLVLASLFLALSFSLAFAKVGVGVGLGKIQIDEALSPGGIYNLPSLPVLNTGDEDLEYEVEVTYLSEQEEMQPAGEWFNFSPQRFPLTAGSSQTVDIVLTLPVDTRPGDYFAFLEAHPVAEKEGVTIGVAAATKLNFTIKPKGVLGAAIERIRSLIEANKPVAYVIAGIVVGGSAILLANRYLDIKIGFKGAKEEKEKKEEEEA